jgi:uncharacterized protein with HEPN domain
MSFEPREYIRHIPAETTYLLERSEGMEFDAFVSDDTLRRAFVRGLEVIGEATKHVPASLRDQEPAVDRRGMAGLRDRLIHRYFDVDCESSGTSSATNFQTFIPGSRPS